MGPYKIYSGIFLILSVCLWIYFSAHAISEFLIHLEYEKRVLQEAHILTTTVCTMPREDIAGNLIDCERARTTSLHHSPHIKALETTASIISSDIFIILTEGVKSAGHAMGLMGFFICVALYASSLLVRAMSSRISNEELYSNKEFSPSLQAKHQSHVNITEISTENDDQTSNIKRRNLICYNN